MLKYHIDGRQSFKTNKRFGLNKFSLIFESVDVYRVSEEKRHIFLNLFKRKDATFSSSLSSEYMGNIISGTENDDTIKVLEYLLKNNYKKLQFKFINEFNFSMMMMAVLAGFSQSQQNKKDPSQIDDRYRL